MSDLSAKFNALESQLDTQHTALIAALDGLGAKLDAITTALGGAPPTPTVSLADVVAAIEGTNTILGDVHLDTQSLDQKLLRIRDAINPLDETLPAEAKTSMPWLLFRLVDAIQPSWPRPTSTPAQPALSLLLALAQLQLPNLADIYAALGAPSGDATTTALGLLASIQYSNTGIYASTGVSSGPSNTILSLLAQEVDCTCAQGGNGSAGGTCAAPFTSSGMQLIPFAVGGGTNVIVAVWANPLPTGINFGSFFGLADQYAELYSADWTGWRVLVQSDEQQYADTPTSTARYPTGVWRAMPPGAGNYSWAVSDRGAITVTLCRGIDFTPAESTCETVVVPGDPNDNNPQGTALATLQVTTTSYAHWISSDAAYAPTVGIYIDGVFITGQLGPGHLYVGPYPPGLWGFTIGRQSGYTTIEVCTGQPPS